MISTDNFSNAKVLVVGDVMLDRYWWGSVNRISPEAPVTVVSLEKTTMAVGGAANVAANIAGLGAKPYLIGTIGNDDDGALFPRILGHIGVDASHLVESDSKPTIVKTRIVAHNQHVVRVDKEVSRDVSTHEEETIKANFDKLISEIDVIVLSDYAKGLLTDNLISYFITSAQLQSKPVLVDPKGKNYKKYYGATLLTPNRREAADACGLEETMQDLVHIAGAKLIDELSIDSLLITQGENGMTLFQKDELPFHLNAQARHVFDVTGAGDTVVATLAVGLASGHSIRDAAQLANMAAGFVVEEVGTSIIQKETLEKGLHEANS